MTFTKDSPLAAAVVPAGSTEHGPRPGGARDIAGIVDHMAEGGGTVSWLTRNDGNCSHYVVEYSGRLVQMVEETHWAGSIKSSLIRRSDDPAFTYQGQAVRYGRTAAVRVLGVTRANDPNRYVIAIEVEGYAATGPNAKQRATLSALVADIRRRRGRSLPVLGHRDFQDWKACPGHLFPWADYGGHAEVYVAPVIPAPPAHEEVPTVAQKGTAVPEVPTWVYLRDDPAKAGRSRWLYVWDDHRADAGNRQMEPNRRVYLTRLVDGDTYGVAYEPTAADTNLTSQEMFVRTVDILRTEPVPLADCAAAVAADRKLARIVWAPA